MEISWTEILKIVAGVIAALGGGCFIVVALSSWLGKVWANRLMAKETAKFREDLERLAKQLERKNYVSKVRFDAEFAMYRELIDKSIKMIEATLDLHPNGVVYTSHEQRLPKEIQENNVERFHVASEAYNAAYKVILQNAAFISLEMYEEFESLRKLCLWYNGAFMDYYCCENSSITREGNLEDFNTFRKTPDEIRTKRTILLAHLREYLSNLDVMDEK